VGGHFPTIFPFSVWWQVRGSFAESFNRVDLSEVERDFALTKWEQHFDGNVKSIVF
jgi:hypothetical protein